MIAIPVIIVIIVIIVVIVIMVLIVILAIMVTLVIMAIIVIIVIIVMIVIVVIVVEQSNDGNNSNNGAAGNFNACPQAMMGIQQRPLHVFENFGYCFEKASPCCLHWEAHSRYLRRLLHSSREQVTARDAEGQRAENGRDPRECRSSKNITPKSPRSL